MRPTAMESPGLIVAEIGDTLAQVKGPVTEQVKSAATLPVPVFTTQKDTE
ncbi:MAG: hypothetical protein IPF77_17755 [Gemmatimonadetes bacterium]|nr:hypothetical protein [Gemmatimonadota bacterium]MBK6781285.1 hypothetical protein [Gemmatimonadota bacterium]